MTIHVVGAGLAGLACALAAIDAGQQVVVHESSGHAGGRCRSWYDPVLETVIDNGTHMVVGGNRAVFGFLDRIGNRAALSPGPAAFPFHDLDNGRDWRASPLRLLPSVLASTWRMGGPDDGGEDGIPIARRLGLSRHYRAFWEPLALAVMNTPAEEASSQVFRRVLTRTLWRGQAASRPYLATGGLSAAFVAPAVAALSQGGCRLRLHHPLRRLEFDGQRATALVFDDETLHPAIGDQVVLALPWTVAATLLPMLPALPESPIVNAHFRLSAAAIKTLPARLTQEGFLGLLGGAAQWLFLRGDLLSVTVSAARELAAQPAEQVAAGLWSDVRRALGLSSTPTAVRVIKEKRATLYHSPPVERLRPAPRLGGNLLLAGDWTATGLPCTLEGAILSGQRAAREILAAG